METLPDPEAGARAWQEWSERRAVVVSEEEAEQRRKDWLCRGVRS